MNMLLIALGKAVSMLSRLIGKGSGSTWPGHVALSLNKNFLLETAKKNPGLKTIFVVGTNGKTTTATMLADILQKNGKRVFQNTSGANLLNGIASSFIKNSNFFGKIKADFAIFEVDENTLPYAISQIMPYAIIVLNLYRDQLDRYGELDSIIRKWKASFVNLPSTTAVFLNGDDPLIAYLGNGLSSKVSYFGLKKSDVQEQHVSHGADSVYCPRCQHPLIFDGVFFSHNGIWHCENCKLKHPQAENVETIFPLPGLYNKYNTLAAVLTAKQIGIVSMGIEKTLKEFSPAFGRQETVEINGKKVQIFLSKNPTSFNQSLQTVKELGAKHILFVLNDRIPDGRDVSWIWDINLEKKLQDFQSIAISGDRVYDMALRVFYANEKPIENFSTFENLSDAIKSGLANISNKETLYILPTYSAMLEVRKILTGKKIL